MAILGEFDDDVTPPDVMCLGWKGRTVFGSRTRSRASLRCRRGRHHLYTDRLLLSHPATEKGVLIASAGASDSVAQWWLGWPPEHHVSEEDRAVLLAQQPGRGAPWTSPDVWLLIAMDRASGRIAGAVSLTKQLYEIGGWLAPAFRTRGLGQELFQGAATFAHHHLGIATVRAGTEMTNRACAGALTSAGFIATTGPAHHRLPNGRVIFAQWFRHDSEQPSTCP